MNTNSLAIIQFEPSSDNVENITVIVGYIIIRFYLFFPLERKYTSI